MKKIVSLAAFITLVVSATVSGQQVADTLYKPEIVTPAYAVGKGPVVLIDEGHFNFHTRDGRYLPFARLLERDGYITRGYIDAFELSKLKEARILVISNALNEANLTRWYKPVLPAFTAREVETVRSWVRNGGSLFLIADHMPMGGAAYDMAAAFGFEFTDGFAVDTTRSGPAFFHRATGTLSDNVITNGRNPSEKVDTVASFTGQAFPVPDDATSILQFNDRYTLLLSDTAWGFDSTTRYKNIEHWSQLAYKKYGKGRVVVSGEAAMFSAQLAGPQQYRAGMNSPVARENYRLLLNIIHWLDGKMEQRAER
ncbi:MAG: hypothetical protein IH593_06455 [Bacteroidales bacterium]|nr:hypothetical protein [Bacteroidales bacterium]